MSKYRKMENGEIIQKNDEYISVHSDGKTYKSKRMYSRSRIATLQC